MPQQQDQDNFLVTITRNETIPSVTLLYSSKKEAERALAIIHDLLPGFQSYTEQLQNSGLKMCRLSVAESRDGTAYLTFPNVVSRDSIKIINELVKQKAFDPTGEESLESKQEALDALLEQVQEKTRYRCELLKITDDLSKRATSKEEKQNIINAFIVLDEMTMVDDGSPEMIGNTYQAFQKTLELEEGDSASKPKREQIQKVMQRILTEMKIEAHIEGYSAIFNAPNKHAMLALDPNNLTLDLSGGSSVVGPFSGVFTSASPSIILNKETSDKKEDLISGVEIAIKSLDSSLPITVSLNNLRNSLERNDPEAIKKWESEVLSQSTNAIIHDNDAITSHLKQINDAIRGIRDYANSLPAQTPPTYLSPDAPRLPEAPRTNQPRKDFSFGPPHR